MSAALVHMVQLRQWRRGVGRALFNLANPALAAAVAVGCARLAGIERGGWVAPLAIAIAALAYYATNVGVIALNMAAHTGNPLWQIVRDSLWSAPTTILIGLIGGFVGVASGGWGCSARSFSSCRCSSCASPWPTPRGRIARRSRSWSARMREIEQAHAEKERTLQQMITTVAAIIDARDQAVAGHSNRVAKYARAIGEELGLSPHQVSELHTAGLLHDLGKIAIPEAILHKPSKLTAEEFAVVKEHAATGERILAQVQPLLAVAQMVGDHHERFDGHGYPNGEAGNPITRGGHPGGCRCTRLDPLRPPLLPRQAARLGAGGGRSLRRVALRPRDRRRAPTRRTLARPRLLRDLGSSHAGPGYRGRPVRCTRPLLRRQRRPDHTGAQRALMINPDRQQLVPIDPAA